jgi:hypothetical protein
VILEKSPSLHRLWLTYPESSYILVLPVASMVSTAGVPAVVSAHNPTTATDVAVNHILRITRQESTQNQSNAIQTRRRRDEQLFQDHSAVSVHLPPPPHALRLLSIGQRTIITVGSSLALILPSDGGGVRGIMSLLILERLIPRGNRPCEVFDLIGGTSTGG